MTSHLAVVHTLTVRHQDPREKPIPTPWQTPIDRWLDHLAAAGSTPQSLRTRRDHVRRVARALRQSPTTVTGDQLVAWASRQRWARETRRSVYNSLRSFFSWLAGDGQITTDPTSVLPAVRPSEPRPRPTPDPVYRAALDQVTDPRVRVALRLAAEAGLRRTEVSLVHARDLHPDLLGWTITVHGKGGKTRDVPLSDDLAKLVQVQADGDWLLPGRIDGHMSGQHLGKLVAKALPGVWTMHTLRHRFGTLAADGGDLIAVQRLLGHASVATTQRYVARPDDALRRAAQLAA